MPELDLKHHLQTLQGTQEEGSVYLLRKKAIEAVMRHAKTGNNFVLSAETKLDEFLTGVVATRLQFFIITSTAKNLSTEVEIEHAAEMFALEFHSALSEVLRDRRFWQREARQSPYLARHLDGRRPTIPPSPKKVTIPAINPYSKQSKTSGTKEGL